MPYIFLKETAAQHWHRHAVLLLSSSDGLLRQQFYHLFELLRGHWTLGRFSSISNKKDNFCDFLFVVFVALNNKTLLKRDKTVLTALPPRKVDIPLK